MCFIHHYSCWKRRSVECLSKWPVITSALYVVVRSLDQACYIGVKTWLGNSNVTDITFQRFLETLGAHFIYLQVLNLKSFTAITKQSSWIVHPMRLRSIFWISYEISYIMTAVTDITFFGSHILHTNTFVEKSVSLWISQRHFHYWCNDKIMYLCFLGTFCENCWACTV